MDASAMGYRQKALRRSLPDEALRIDARQVAPNRSFCLTSAMSHDLGSAVCVLSCAGLSHRTEAKMDPRTELTPIERQPAWTAFRKAASRQN